MARWDLSKLPEGRKPLPDEWFAERAQMQDRIKELEARINFLIQPEMIAPSLSYRGWLIIDESDGNGNFWYAYDYDWKSGGFDDDKNFAMVSGDLDDVIEAIDRRIAELTGGKHD